MKLIVGLGNPGEEYSNTRHNVGFSAVNELRKKISDHESWEMKKNLKCFFLKTPEYILIKPVTFMNLSGEAVKAVAEMYKIAPADIWVIHDDLDIEKGKIKIQIAGGSAGHNGIKSITQSLGTNEFMRWRIGIKKELEQEIQDSAGYVLEKFTKEESEKIITAIKNTVESIEFAQKNTLLETMNKYN